MQRENKSTQKIQQQNMNIKTKYFWNCKEVQ